MEPNSNTTSDLLAPDSEFVKICFRCKVNPADDRKNNPTYCKSCRRLQHAEWIAKNPSKLKKYEANRVRNLQLRNKYAKSVYQVNRELWRQRRTGWSPEEFERVWEAQNGKCQICLRSMEKTGSKENCVATDHCHKTKKIRGLLCNRCNVSIGRMNDDPDLLQRAVDYLRRYI